LVITVPKGFEFEKLALRAWRLSGKLRAGTKGNWPLFMPD